MSKTQLIDRMVTVGEGKIAGKAGASKALKAVADEVVRSLSEKGAFTLPGVGAFKVEVLPGRETRNARTGGKIMTPATNVVKFTPAVAVRKAVQLRPVRP